jgi:hypothetical protein
MKELKENIKNLVDESRDCKAKLQDLYTAVTGELTDVSMHSHIDVVNMAMIAKEANDLISYTTSDEYVSLFNLMQEDES